jgi:hypothetical protein
VLYCTWVGPGGLPGNRRAFPFPPAPATPRHRRTIPGGSGVVREAEMAAMAASLSRATFFGTNCALTTPCKQRVCVHTGAFRLAVAARHTATCGHLPRVAERSRAAPPPPKLMWRTIYTCNGRRRGGRRSKPGGGVGCPCQRRGGRANCSPLSTVLQVAAPQRLVVQAAVIVSSRAAGSYQPLLGLATAAGSRCCSGAARWPSAPDRLSFLCVCACLLFCRAPARSGSTPR